MMGVAPATVTASEDRWLPSFGHGKGQPTRISVRTGMMTMRDVRLLSTFRSTFRWLRTWNRSTDHCYSPMDSMKTYWSRYSDDDRDHYLYRLLFRYLKRRSHRCWQSGRSIVTIWVKFIFILRRLFIVMWMFLDRIDPLSQRIVSRIIGILFGCGCLFVARGSNIVLIMILQRRGLEHLLIFLFVVVGRTFLLRFAFTMVTMVWRRLFADVNVLDRGTLRRIRWGG